MDKFEQSEEKVCKEEEQRVRTPTACPKPVLAAPDLAHHLQRSVTVLVKADVICDERSKAEHFHSESNFVVFLWVLNSCPAM